jgi:predicted RNA-binding protein with PIN domain
MPYAIDGNNLIGAVSRVSRPSEQQRKELVAAVGAFLRATRARATIVFDGASETGRLREHLGSLTVVYARSADDAIVAMLRGARSAKDWIVVTDDRELADRARELGARREATAGFLPRLRRAEPGPGSERAPAVDIADWEAYFADPRNRRS